MEEYKSTTRSLSTLIYWTHIYAASKDAAFELKEVQYGKH